jgi:uncharacterized protein (DUF885 family)|tara:strand:- start:17388 stop:19244 length:1857 start_codon:yes stop_codon:yes gene_type:complete
MTFNKSLIVISLSAVFAVACSNEPASMTKTNNAAAVTTDAAQLDSIALASQAANELFDTIFMEGVNRNPVMQTYLGIKTDYDKWQDLSEENSAKELAFAKEALQRIQVIDITKVDKQTKLSFKLLSQKLEQQIADYQWRHHNYPVNQMFGVHSRIPALLINQHSIKDVKQAHDYIARVKNSKLLLEQLIEQLQIRADKGIIAPKFVFAHVIRDSKNLIVGVPFDEGTDSTLYADFKKKIAALEISEAQKQALTAELTSALTNEFKAGYQQLVSYLTELEKKADNTDGAWKFPQGDKFYNNALNRTTTTDLTADDIHQIGLDEVKRIHDEMRVIMNKVGFKGNLTEFFAFMRHDPQFYYAGDDAGRQRYLTEATDLINTMKGELDQLFITKPKADLKVKKVEAFREKSAGKAFYQQPAPDGSRPGIYYANLYDMEAMPTYQMEALAYHEGIPGHHMQIALKQELEGIPKFRKFGGYTAYSEGWGLYSEMIPKEIGFYQDPYSDFGRLAMELWRACRLVVDTGIHNKKWTRAQGLAYYVDNTPNAESDAVKMVERHVVMPSQATAYKIGMLKIVQLRAKAKQQLGDKFDIREFHDVVLTNGAVPLNVLEDMVNDYIAKNR